MKTNMPLTNFHKWFSTMVICWKKHTAYKLNFFLEIIGPALVFFFIKYNLWSTIYSSNSAQLIGGYTFEQMIDYHCWALIISLIAKGHNAGDLAGDIRLGRISTYLIYPFNFWEFHTASFLSFEAIQICIGAITLGLLSFFGIIQSLVFQHILSGLAFCIVLSFFWYSVQYLTGLISFWLEETWMIRVMFQIIATFLSGAVIPLELFPKFLQNILMYTPFPYLTYYPIKIFTGEHIDLTMAILPLVIWIIFINIINRYVWKKGVNLYTAAGM